MAYNVTCMGPDCTKTAHKTWALEVGRIYKGVGVTWYKRREGGWMSIETIAGGGVGPAAVERRPLDIFSILLLIYKHLMDSDNLEPLHYLSLRGGDFWWKEKLFYIYIISKNTSPSPPK